MASRLALMRVGWGYALLGDAIWVVLLRVIDPPVLAQEGGPSAARTLLGIGVASGALSLIVPQIFGRFRALRSLFVPESTLGPDAGVEERAREKKAREARLFDLYVVSWVLSLVMGGIPGMAGLLLSFYQPERGASYALMAAALVLTTIRFPTERALREAVETR